jgi:hypothetical protein
MTNKLLSPLPIFSIFMLFLSLSQPLSAQLPDYTISNVISPAFFRVNEPLNISFHVKNIGNAPTNPIVNAITLNDLVDFVLVSNDPNNFGGFLGRVIKKTSAPVGFDTLINFSTVIPRFINPGSYTLEIQADHSSSIPESNENNNVVRIPIEVRGPATDNQKLIVTNVTGNNRVEPSAVLSVNVTVKNNSSLPSVPDSVFVGKWSNISTYNSYFPTNYSLNKVAIPAIAAGQSVTIPATFAMPSILSSDVLSKIDSNIIDFLEPYFMTKAVADYYNSFSPPIAGDSAKKISYFYPILPASTADLALSGSQITTTWDSINNTVDVRLRLVNNGPNTAKNIFVEINRASTYGNYNYPAIIEFTQTSGTTGSVDQQFVKLGGRDEIGYRVWSWKIPQLTAGTTVEATFRGRVITEFGAPQTTTFYYKDITIRPKIQYVDAQDNVRANDSIAGGFTIRFVPTTTPTNYCASKSLAPWELWTSSVVFNTINNTSNKFKDIATLGYSDYTNLSTTLTRGQSYPLSITPSLSWVGNTGNAYCRVWIDFNKNKIFEANEVVLEKNSANLFTNNVLIPTTATLGNVRMRVAMKWGAFPTACETFDRGEVEDYTVTISNTTVDPCTAFTFETRNVIWNATTVQYDIRGLGVIGGYIPHVDYRELRPDGTIVNTGIGNTSGVWFTVIEYIGNSDTLKNAILISLPAGDCGKPYTFIRPRNTNQPDLTLQNLTISTPSVQQGQILNFKADFKNIGTTAASGSFTMKSYLSTDKVLSANDYADGVVQTGNYAAGFTVAQVPAAMTVRTTVAAGQYYLILKIDADNQVAESNENNNAIVSTNLITVTPQTTPLPDIRITNIVPAGTDWVTTTFKGGDVAGMSVTVVNGNNITPGPLQTTFYLSADTLLDVRDSVWEVWTTGTNEIFAAGGVIPRMADGDYFVIAKTNSDNRIQESNTANNVYVMKSPKMKIRNATTGGSDIALSMTSTPSLYRQYTAQNFRITAKNSGTTAFSNVKIKFTRPALTSSGGSKVASIGTFQDFCPGGIECSEWTIPTLAGGATATLDAPVFILAPTGGITATATLLSSIPTDNVAANNTASITVNSSTAPIAQPLALVIHKPTQLIPVVIQKVNPTITESEITLELESLIDKMVDFSIANSMGQTVLSQALPIEKGFNKVPFDVSSLPQGMYFIQLNVGKGRNVPSKFIKM